MFLTRLRGLLSKKQGNVDPEPGSKEPEQTTKPGKKLFIIILAASILIIAGLVVWNKVGNSYWNKVFSTAFKDVNCPAARDPKMLPDGYYKGPMIDTHIHLVSLPDSPPGAPNEGENLGTTRSMAEWICMMDYEGTHKAFGFFPVWGHIAQSVEVVTRTMKNYPDRFVPFIMPPDNDGNLDGYSTVDARALQEMLNVKLGTFRGFGEIGLYERSDGQGKRVGAAALPPDSVRLMEIYPVLRQHKLVAYFHLGFGQKEAFERAVRANRDITFIFHGGNLYKIPQDQAGISHDEKILADIEEVLYNNPNVYYGVDELYGGEWLLKPGKSKESFLANFVDYKPLIEKDLSLWKGFIERHPDQVLWGTDRGVSNSWDVDPEVALTLNNYTRYFIGKLNSDVQEKFAYKNAERLLAE